jgi:hypothetical protein
MSDTQTPFDPDKFVGAPSPPAPPPFNFGKLAQATIDLLTTNARLVMILSFCIMSLPKLAVVATHLSFHGTRSDEDPAYDVLNSITGFLDIGAIILLQLVLSWALTRRRQGLDLSLGSVAALIIPALILYILSALGFVVGLILLIIPGLILLVRWSVAWPILLVEGKTALQSMGRSAGLVRGYGWPIFGAILMCLFFDFAWTFVVDFFGAILSEAFPEKHVDWMFEALVSPYGSLPSSALAIALYFHVVTLKEGGAERTIAEVFD